MLWIMLLIEWNMSRKYMDKDPNSKYYVVMLTDGLDNWSGYIKNKIINGNTVKKMCLI